MEVLPSRKEFGENAAATPEVDGRAVRVLQQHFGRAIPQRHDLNENKRTGNFRTLPDELPHLQQTWEPLKIHTRETDQSRQVSLGHVYLWANSAVSGRGEQFDECARNPHHSKFDAGNLELALVRGPLGGCPSIGLNLVPQIQRQGKDAAQRRFSQE